MVMSEIWAPPEEDGAAGAVPDGAIAADGDASGDGPNVGKGERTRRRILDAAARRLASQGYAATRLVQIAADAGIAPGSLYFHFGSKDVIVEEVLRVGIEHARAAISSALTHDAPVRGIDRLREAAVAHVTWIVSESHYSVSNIRCYSEAPDATRDNLAVALREFVDEWVALIAAGQADGSIRGDVDPPVQARILVSALNSCANWYRPGGRLPVGRLAEEVTASVVDGLAAEQLPPEPC